MTQKNQIIKIVTVSILVFIVLLFLALMINLIRYTRVTALESELKEKISERSKQIEDNQQEIIYKSDLEYIEKYARELLNMKKRGEKIFVGT